MPTEDPLVSAIMPTRGRHGWAADAVRMFDAQTWPAKELIVIDDISEPSFPHGLLSPSVIYERAPRISVGCKRNLACSRARGEIICHWDSDDVYAPDRIEHQVSLLLSHDVDMVGYSAMRFEEVDGQMRKFMYHGMPDYCIGVSMMYWASTWFQRPFADTNVGEDGDFLAGRRVFACEDDAQRIIARIHADNTAEKRAHIPRDPKRWRLIEA